MGIEYVIESGDNSKIQKSKSKPICECVSFEFCALSFEFPGCAIAEQKSEKILPRESAHESTQDDENSGLIFHFNGHLSSLEAVPVRALVTLEM